jgi:hypothetical protein
LMTAMSALTTTPKSSPTKTMFSLLSVYCMY